MTCLELCLFSAGSFACVMYILCCLCYVQFLCLWTVQLTARHSLRSSRAPRARWARSVSHIVYPVIVKVPFDRSKEAHGHIRIVFLYVYIQYTCIHVDIPGSAKKKKTGS